MKKLMVVLLSAMLVLGYAASAMADVTFSGDARVRGIMHSDYDLNGDVDSAGTADGRWWDQRVRLKADGKVGDVMVKTRFTVSEGIWNGAGENTDVTTGGGVKVDDDDYAYIVAPIGMVEVNVGRQLLSWGNKFMVWMAGVDQLKAYYKDGDLKVGAYTIKDREVQDGDNGNDMDEYALLGVNKFGDWTAGIIGVYATDGAADVNGQIINVYGAGPAGPASVAGEIAYKGGDLFGDNADMGMFVAGSMNFDAITASLAGAYAADGYVASKYFTPTLLFGTSQASALTNFGASVDDSSTFAIVAGADYTVSDATKVGGKLAFASFSDNVCAVEDSCSLIEIDLLGSYKIADNVMYSADIAYGIPSDISGVDDSALGVSHRIELSF